MANDKRGFDDTLRERVMESYDRFLKTLDAALAAPVPEILDELRDDADSLMRAIARVRLEIERVTGQ